MSSALLEPPAATDPMSQSLPKPTSNRTPAARSVHGLNSQEVERAVLTGFMGSGKSTVGRLLAERLGWEFLDLDEEIEHRDGRSVPQIFAESGELAFRKLEASALASVLGRRHIVLALGGGAPEALGNRLLLEQTPHTAVLYLRAELPTLLARCAAQSADPCATARPLLTGALLSGAHGVTETRGDLEARFKSRHPLYDRIATHQVDTEALTLTEVLNAIDRILHPQILHP